MDLIWLTVLAILALLVLSAFFSASETALTAASRPRMHALAKEGNRRARLVEALHAEKERLIGAILLGNNVVNITASSLATGAMVGLFGERGVVYASVAMTALVLIFGEVLPKTWAIHHADRAAMAVAPPIRRVVWLLAPITRVVQLAVNAVLSLFGVHVPKGSGVSVSVEELRGAIELHGRDDRGGDDDGPREAQRERAMLRSILELDDVAVSEIMIHRRRVVAFDADQPAEQLVDAILASPYTRIPVWRSTPDNIIGVLHAKALLRALKAQAGQVGSVDIAGIATPPWFIPETTTLLAQLEAFRRRREHFAIVVDEYGSLGGIVTLEDILEEIVGNIDDEHDVVLQGVRPQPDGSYIVAGTVTLRDLARELDWHLPDDNASTIAGLVLNEARTIPDAGQVFAFHSFRFEVLRRQRNQITTLRVTPPAPETLTAADGSS
ncbi:Mg2+/Co2+ transporter CorB [Stella humosa]|uniref:Mg2+/Co2+ transporter CorB n=1 Tax=Stella humosa TaxID=94 RepID=A0A3N1LPL8_9PROT|nr:HlyC/CorC family transporter [Stella humosa]ROP91155.1 Mg2+/Co2+ transporter CorB [Stella humosa]BBK34493.1 membrane protein [Stella humosa]